MKRDPITLCMVVLLALVNPTFGLSMSMCVKFPVLNGKFTTSRCDWVAMIDSDLWCYMCSSWQEEVERAGTAKAAPAVWDLTAPLLIGRGGSFLSCVTSTDYHQTEIYIRHAVMCLAAYRLLGCCCSMCAGENVNVYQMAPSHLWLDILYKMYMHD